MRMKFVSFALPAALLGLMLAITAATKPSQAQTVVSTACASLAAGYVTGQTGRPVTIDENGRTCATAAPSSATGVTPTSSAALTANTTVKASAGNLYSFEVSADATLSAAAWWIMIYNATSAPVDGAVTPVKCYAMPANTTSFSAAFPTPAAFSTGITIGVSTTGCFTKTASVHAFISGDAQ